MKAGGKQGTSSTDYITERERERELWINKLKCVSWGNFEPGMICMRYISDCLRGTFVSTLR